MMKTYCTRPNCSQPINEFPELDDPSNLTTAQQKYCETCEMPQILGGRYIPEKLLGKGGFGAAYLGFDRHSVQFRQCVIKQFQPSPQLSRKKLKVAEDLFSREAEALEILGNQHSQIPDLYAFFPLINDRSEEQEQREFFYIVQEYIDGETLEQEVKRKGKLTENEILEILEEMLNVLNFVHQHNSIHRDIKPSNIMRDRAGKLYLLDFGAVKQVTGATDQPSSTGIYSVGYAPPEQMQGGKVYPATDIYALGATCVRLLAGQPIQELYDFYDNQWCWQDKVDISEQLQNLLEKMLLKTPRHRFQSAEDILNALHHPTNEPQEKVQISPPKTVNHVNPTQQKDIPTKVNPLPQNPVSRQLWEWLLDAGLTGLIATSLLIALNSIWVEPAISMGLWGMLMGGLIYALWKKIIQGIDLWIIGGVTFALILFVPILRDLTLARTLAAMGAGSAGAIALISLYRLIKEKTLS